MLKRGTLMGTTATNDANFSGRKFRDDNRRSSDFPRCDFSDVEFVEPANNMLDHFYSAAWLGIVLP